MLGLPRCKRSKHGYTSAIDHRWEQSLDGSFSSGLQLHRVSASTNREENKPTESSVEIERCSSHLEMLFLDSTAQSQIRGSQTRARIAALTITFMPVSDCLISFTSEVDHSPA